MMENALFKKERVEQLRQEMLRMQGLHKGPEFPTHTGAMELLSGVFPQHRFPRGAIHEFLSPAPEAAAATTGFLAALIGMLMQRHGPCLWISHRRKLFPPALNQFGVSPERMIFIDLSREKDLLWAMEEALRCEGLAAVVGEVRDISLTESRRLQLAVEKSQVTGFLHRCFPRRLSQTACVSRWQIRPMPSRLENGLPGVGHPCWDVHLLKIRHGQPGRWSMEWAEDGFRYAGPAAKPAADPYQKTG